MPEVVVRVYDQIASAAARLREAGVEEPRREAVRLWHAVADGGTVGRSDGRTGRAGRRAGGQADSILVRYRRVVARRARGMPWQYAAGVAGFRHLDLRCDARALIPRPETEALVDIALDMVPHGKALDLGTGGGCIALALADEGRYDEVVGVDCSAGALALARYNADVTGHAVRWVQGNWVEPIRGERFDLVVSNPPYVATSELDGLDPLVRGWEPELALDGGPDGLGPTEGILREVPAVLATGGVIVLEVDSRRARETAELAGSLGWIGVTITRDPFGSDRYLTARREPAP